MSFPSSVSRTAEHEKRWGMSSWKKRCLGKDRGQSWTLDPGSDWKWHLTLVIKAVYTCSVIPLLLNLVLKLKHLNFRGKLNKLVPTMNSCTKWI